MIPSSTNEAGTTSLREVLERCGFGADWSACWTEQLPGYYFDFGDFRLEATEVMGKYFRPVFMFTGLHATPRTIGSICFEMPLMVESFEQGAAWIADALSRRRYAPAPFPDWYAIGLENRSLLPWERERAAYGQRPQCSVTREWFRTAARMMREHAVVAEDAEVAYFSFDGEVLKIRAGNMLMAMPGTGIAWPHTIGVRAKGLKGLPLRFTTDPVHVSVWQGRLSIHNRVWNIIEIEGVGGNDE